MTQVSEKALIREMDLVELEAYKHEIMKQPMFIGKSRIYRYILKQIAHINGVPYSSFGFLKEYTDMHKLYHPPFILTPKTTTK